jgi:hypothetical protein|tara:strand:- start:346 stop:1587 length:1242 start_codon:yes stop_codon:yes gene_type:complete
MAENIDSPSLFSIQDTMEMGMGNQQLLSDLFAPEIATSNPDDIQKIDKPSPPPEKKTEAPAKAAAPTTTEETPAIDEKKSITDFLMNDEEEKEDEDEPVKKVSPISTTPNTENNEEEGESNQFTALSKDLLKLGVFSKEEDEDDVPINNAEEFLERFNAEKKKGAIEVVNNFIGQFGEEYQQAFDAIYVKGVNPKDYFGAFNQIQSFADMDLAQEANQVRVITQALTDQGLDPEDVTTEVERLKNYGDLESVAGKHHKVLIKKEAVKLQQLEQEKEVQLQQQAQYKQQYSTNVNQVLQDKLKNKEFDGIPLNPKLAGELQDFLTIDKYKTNSGETLTEFDKTILELKRPENHEKKVKIALLLKILEKDPTLSTIQKTGITKKSNELFGEVARQASKSAVKSHKPANVSTSWFQ